MTYRLHPRRKLAAAVLVLVVTLVHGWITEAVVARIAELRAMRPMPSRLAVTYVRELQLAPPAAAPALSAPPKPPKKRALAPVAKPASAPQPDTAMTPELAKPPETTASAAATQPVPPQTPTTGAGVAPQNATASGDAFEWPPSTRLSYSLIGNYRGEIHGKAQVEWIRAGTHYQVHVDVSLGPSFAPLFTRRMSSEGELTANSLSPQRYDEETRLLFERKRLSVQLGPDEIVLANGQRLKRVGGVQDAASQFVHLAALFATRPELLRVGTAIELLLALPRHLDLWVYDVAEEEALETPFGPIDTFHLTPRRVAQRGGDLTAEIWFAPRLRYLPVRILIRQDADTFIDLLVSRLPDIAER